MVGLPAPTPVTPALDAYDLAPPVELSPLSGPLSGGIGNLVLGVRTGAGEFVWKGYATHADVAAILYEHRLVGWLAGRGLSFAVPVPLPTRDGATLCRVAGGWQALFVRLPGARPDDRDAAQVEAVGAALAELHAALTTYPPDARPGVPPYGDLQRIHPRIPDPYLLTPAELGLPDAPPYDRLLGWWREELAGLRASVEDHYSTLPQQVIHGDCVSGNLLIQDGRITAVLDFDFARPDARAMDVAIGLKYAMRTWDNPDPLPIARAFCRGYARRGWLTTAEVNAMPWLIRLRDAVLAIWCLGRALAAGDARPVLWRVEHLQGSSDWLGRHGDGLVQLVAELAETHRDAPDAQEL